MTDMAKFFEEHPHTRAVLSKMCQMADTLLDDVDFNDHQWFCKHPWEAHQEDAFHKWLVEYMKKNSEARTEMMARPSSNMKEIDKFVSAFIFNYGWKTEDDAK